MRQRFINNFSTLVAATFGAGDTQLQLASTAGLPILGIGEYFYLTVYRQTGIEEREHEVIKVTDVVGDICYVERSVEGAAASQFLAGDRVQARVTAVSLQNKADQIDMTAAQADIVTNANAIATKASQTALDDLTTVVNGKAGQADLLTLQDTVNTKAAITYVDTKVAELVNASPATLDTLNELAAALGNDANFAATTSTALGNRVRVDAAQGLTAPQQTQARTNLGLAAVASSGLKADVGLGDVDNTSDANKPVSAAQAAADALALPKSGGTMTGPIVGGDNLIQQAMLKDVGYTAIDKGNSGTALVTFDYTSGSKQKSTATGNHTFAFAGWPPVGNEGIMRVDFADYGAFTITPPAVTWTNPDGSETTSLVSHFAALAAVGGRAGFTAAGLTKAIFWSSDAGATLYGKFI